MVGEAADIIRPGAWQESDAYDSIGIGVNNSGTIASGLVPGSIADQAGLTPGQQIVGVNGRKFSAARFKEGLADTTTKRSLELLTLRGDLYETVTLEYDGGARYLHLVRNDSEPDILNEIFKAK